MFEKYKNIYTLLGSFKEKTRWTFNYYGPSDMVSYIFIGLIIERSKSILEYYEQHKRTVLDIDSYLDYIFIYIVQKYSNMESDIREEYRGSFRKYSAEYGKIYSQYQKMRKHIVSYIIESYKEIFLYNDETVIVFQNDLRDVTLCVICDYYGGFKQDLPSIIPFLINSFPLYILDKFDMLQSAFCDYPDLLDLLFDDKKTTIFFKFRKETLLSILSSLYHSEKLKSHIKSPIQKIMVLAEDETKNPPDQMLLHTAASLKLYVRFASNIKDKHFHSFIRKQKELQSRLDDYIVNNGTVQSGEIDLSKVLNALRKGDVKLEPILFGLTHYKKDDEWYCFASNLLHTKEFSIIDAIATTNIETDDIFKLSVHQRLSIDLQIKSGAILRILWIQSLRKDFCQYVYQALDTISPDDEYAKKDWAEDLNFLFELLNYAMSDETKLPNHMQVYAVTGFCYSLIDKIFREYYIVNNCNLYFNSQTITLKNTLGDFSPESCITALLGEDQQRLLSYFLCKTHDTHIGRNMRNSFAHWANISRDDLVAGMMGEALYYLIMVINSLVSKAINQETNGNNK